MSSKCAKECVIWGVEVGFGWDFCEMRCVHHGVPRRTTERDRGHRETSLFFQESEEEGP